MSTTNDDGAVSQTQYLCETCDYPHSHTERPAYRGFASKAGAMITRHAKHFAASLPYPIRPDHLTTEGRRSRHWTRQGTMPPRLLRGAETLHAVIVSNLPMDEASIWSPEFVAETVYVMADAVLKEWEKE